MVTIGNPGNAPDTRYNDASDGVGVVDHEYRIGKYEITAGQYTAFLNAVAATDTYRLYEIEMDRDLIPRGEKGCNIKRSGEPGSYTYSVDAFWANRPVNFVSLNSAARFANWLHNGQPTGLQVAGTTEDGAYSGIGTPSQQEVTLVRNPGARFFIPSINEWYKAAYYDGDAGVYSDYPTGYNATPGYDKTEATNSGNNANYAVGDEVNPPLFLTTVGEYELSSSKYGTFDQGGNVAEWTDTPLTNVPTFGDHSGYSLQGGSFEFGPQSMQPLYSPYHLWAQSQIGSDFGFRIASVVPEPNGLTIWGSAVAAILASLLSVRVRRRIGLGC